MTSKNPAYQELSKRVDTTEEEIKLLRARTHELGTSQMQAAYSFEKINDTLSRIVENQENLSLRALEMHKDNLQKFADIERFTSKAKFISENKKPIFWVIVAAMLIGFFLEREIIDVFTLGKFSQIHQIIMGNK